jgi:glucokinase
MGHVTRHLGLDLGGTNIKVAVIERHGDAISTVANFQASTEADEGPAHVVARLIALGRQAIEQHGPIATVGIGIPGLFNADEGSIVLLPNLPGAWPGQHVVGPIAAALGLPVRIINDCRAFTLAEGRLGAATGCDTVVCFVLGTGIGGGAIVNGQLLFGRHGRAAEFGHQVILPGGPLCGCGNRGCLEAVATAAPFAHQAGYDTPHEAVEAARAGDRRALAALDTLADLLGLGIANALTVFVAERVVIGGGIATAGPMLLDRVRAAVKRHQVLVPADWYDIVPATLGSFAGSIGAALWGTEAR